MRLISFALTTEQVRQERKTVTRRMGWRTLQPGTRLQPVEKGQGIPKGQKVQTINGPIRVVSVRREPLSRLLDDPGYGARELVLEGFGPGTSIDSPARFVNFFCLTHRCQPCDLVTRIEWEYAPRLCDEHRAPSGRPIDGYPKQQV